METFEQQHSHIQRSKDAIYELKDGLEDSGHRTANFAERIVHGFKEVGDEGSVQAFEIHRLNTRSTRNMETFIHRYPGLVVLISVCVGVLLAQML